MAEINLGSSETKTILKRMEITTLPACNIKGIEPPKNTPDIVSKELINTNTDQVISAKYGININPIYNNNISIYQEILDPQSHVTTINGKDYYLTQVEFKKSNLSWNNKPVGLELQLIHTDYSSVHNTKIILPLDLTDNPSIVTSKNVESSINLTDTLHNAENILGSKNMANIVSNPIIKVVNNLASNPINLLNNIVSTATNLVKSVEKNIHDLGIKYNFNFDLNKVNNLINNNNFIVPKYNCCRATVGSQQTFYLCEIATIINNMPKYSILKEENGNTFYISHPVPFNITLGNSILNNIEVKS